MYKNLSAPLVVQVEITERCPNKCIHCYNYWRHTGYSGPCGATLDASQIDCIMDEIERSRVFEIVITGGEPLLNKRGMYRILDRVERGQVTYTTINSTLLGLTEADAERLSGYRHLRVVLTSIMGPTAKIHDRISGHVGSFQQTVDGVKLLNRARIPVAANMVVSQLNKKYINQTAAFCKSAGIKIFNATRAVSPMNCPDFSPYALDMAEFRQYLSELGDAGRANDIPVGVLTVYPLCGVRDVRKHYMTAGRRCSAGVTVAVISATGEVRACAHVQESVGSIFSESLPVLWDKLIPWRNGSLLPATCRDCRALAICGGGCRVDAQVVNGSLCSEDPLMGREDVEAAIEEHQLFRQQSKTEVAVPSMLKLNPNLRWRCESFGSVWYLNQRCVGVFNTDTTELLLAQVGRSITAADLAEAVPEEFLKGLLEKRVLIAHDEPAS